MNRFTPIKVSSFIYDKVKQNALQRGNPDPSRLIKFQTDTIYRGLFRDNLFESPADLFTENINIIKDRGSYVTSPKYKQAPNVPLFGANQVETPIIPNITPNRFENTGNVLSPSDASQLAKSGDIDITEAIAARRT